MERPEVKTEPKQRDITGEIVYLDEMRRQNEAPKPFLELSDLAIQMYEASADMYTDGRRPAIMDEYEQYDYQLSEVVASCQALADELLKLKDPSSPLTFVDIVTEESSDTILAKLRAISAGSVLAADDEQLAIPSDGEYYPILDIRKQNAQLNGAGLRVWGWNNPKHIFINRDNEKYRYPDHMLVYPADETSATRQIELTFGYCNKDGTRFTESVSLHLSANGSAEISSQVWVSAYAETGYEGHGGKYMQEMREEDVAAFADLIAEIVGDEPNSVTMKINQQLQELTDNAATPAAQQIVRDLIDLTWPAQANYFLTRQQDGEDRTIAELLRDEATVDEAVTAIGTIMIEWKARLEG